MSEPAAPLPNKSFQPPRPFVPYAPCWRTLLSKISEVRPPTTLVRGMIPVF